MSKLSDHAISTGYFIAGVVNTLPVIGVLSNEKLSALYGIDVLSDDLSLLLRHRAVLFLVVGVLLLVSVVKNKFRLASGIAGLVAMMSFVLLAWTLPTINPSLQRIVTIDIVTSVILCVAFFAHIKWKS